MPRQARKKSESSTYHIMIRGINRQQIFEDAEDYDKFMEILQYYQEISEYKVYAYCLMSNHIHLLMKFDKEDISQSIQRISTKYVYWYNTKYARTGHLFQDRYKSEPVDDDAYFMCVLRYIHQNPVKAGLCSGVDGYRYSSFYEYKYCARIIDTEFVYNYIPKNEFETYNNATDNTICLEMQEQSASRITDDAAKQIIYQLTRSANPSEFQNLPIDKRNQCLKVLKEKGVSVRQISRLTGISYYTVQKI